MRAEKAVQENRIFSMASEIGEFIGNRAYRALLAEVYYNTKAGDWWICFLQALTKIWMYILLKRVHNALYPWFVRMAAQGAALQTEVCRICFVM